jgi:hypothetical protein
LELISIHIPKTAGTSFRNVLKSVYGDEHVVRFDISMRSVVRMNEKPYFAKELPAAKVIHGHFFYKAIVNNFGIPEGCPVITWLRDPVQRVISNYYYLESRLIDMLQEKKRDLQILERMQRSLVEFARIEMNRNRQSKQLRGVTLDKLAFVGIQEYFETDIKILAGILKWNKMPDALFHNKTKSIRAEIPAEVEEEIQQLNRGDVELYEEALRLRGLNRIAK